MAIPDAPLTRAEQYLNRIATDSGTIPDEPLTRVEQYLNRIATGSGTIPDEPLTRVEQYLAYIAENGSGGGGSVTVDSALSSTSENPVQNKVVKAALDGKGTYSKPSSGIPKSDLASAVQTSLGKADTALQQHQSLAAYRTASAQDTIDAGKANSADLATVAFSGDYNDLLNRPDDGYVFADEIPQDADHADKYVLPDGYIYIYGEHTYHRVYNAATDGLLNKVPVQNQNVETTGDKAGAFLSAPIPWDSSWTQYEQTPTVVRITGNKTLLPIWYNSAIQVFYYKANGDFKFSLNQSAIHSFVGGSPALGESIPLPCEFNLADNNFYPLDGTGYVRIYLGISADGAITANDVNDIVINVPFYDSDVTATEWYNSGERYTSDPQVEQNTEDIAALDTRVTALEEDSGSGGGISVHTNQVLYAVGDSITRGAVAGGEDYAWPKHVIDINGYDATNSVNLGQNGLGFDTAATGSGDTIKAIVDRTDFSAADIVTVALGCNDWKTATLCLQTCGRTWSIASIKSAPTIRIASCFTFCRSICHLVERSARFTAFPLKAIATRLVRMPTR